MAVISQNGNPQIKVLPTGFATIPLDPQRRRRCCCSLWSTASSLLFLPKFHPENTLLFHDTGCHDFPMTTRPSFSSSARPLSAIFLGSVSSPNNLPDLPEPPPSPGAASNGSGSGLPSPPATNSTGSGSTGDDTANFGSVRHRPASLSHSSKSAYSTPPNANMLNGNYDNETGSRLTTNIQEDHEDDEIENDNDEDNTARLDRRRSLKTPNENILALQRVKSLTQRNRLVSGSQSFFLLCS